MNTDPLGEDLDGQALSGGITLCWTVLLLGTIIALLALTAEQQQQPRKIRGKDAPVLDAPPAKKSAADTDTPAPDVGPAKDLPPAPAGDVAPDKDKGLGVTPARTTLPAEREK